MRARADAARSTRRAVIQAAIDLYYERPGPDSTLEQIAERAGVTVQTVLRHFGTRATLDEAARAEAVEQVRAERLAPAGDVDRALRALFVHYERRGRAVLALLAQEVLGGTLDLSGGRAEHRRWVGEVWARQLARRTARRRVELIDQLVVATDVYTWKLLRLDRGLSRGAAQRRVKDMIIALLSARREN